MAAVVLDSTTVSLLRRDDMLVLDLSFTNVSLFQDGADPATLSATDPSAQALVEFDFPPQAMVEQTYPAGSASPGIRPGPAGALFSGPSRITFVIPQGTSVPFTAAGLLGWTALMSTAERTGIECVWGLVVLPSDIRATTWLHAAAPSTTPGGVTGLWHTRLVGRTAAGGADLTGRAPLNVTMRAAAPGDPSFPAALRGVRSTIAQQSAETPVEAHQLLLSALGASVNFVGDWTDLAYGHRSFTGRDQAVHTVQRGLLLPFGFRAVVDQFTVRGGGQTDLDGSAALITTARITILDPEVSFDPNAGMQNQGRGFPVQSVRVSEALAFAIKPPAYDEDDPSSYWVDDPSGGGITCSG